MFGETAIDIGFYDVIVSIALIAISVALLEFGLSLGRRSQSPRKRRWGLPFVNVLAGFGLLGICATPWAYYNVDSPLADRVFQVRALIAPESSYARPGPGPWYNFDVNPYVWRCDVGACDGDPMNTISIYHHRHLPISYRFIVYSDCMTPEFNLATARAIEADMTGYDGDRRRTARAFFDQDGRFIGPKYRWFNTPLMQSQLSHAEKEPSPVSFDWAMNQLTKWDHAFYSPSTLPTWTDWEVLSATIKSGEVSSIHHSNGLLVGLRMRDGSELIGTQTHQSDLRQLLESCGTDCSEIEIRR